MSELAASTRVLTFRLGADLYAVDVFSVERVLRYHQPRSIPNTPVWVDGVIEYDGEVLSVIDFPRRLGAQLSAVTAQTRLLVLLHGAERVAAAVDQVLDVRPVAPHDIAPAPALVRGLVGDVVRGVLRRNGMLVVLLDVDGILGATGSLTFDGSPEPAMAGAEAVRDEQERDDSNV